MRPKKIDILIVICLFLLAFLLRSNVSNIFPMGDEFIYAKKTSRILVNNFAPVDDVFRVAPPLLPYTGAIFAFSIGDVDIMTLRWISVLFGSLTIPIMYYLGKTMYNKKTGILAAILLCFSPYHILYSRLYMQEALTLFFIIFFLYFFWKNEYEDKKLVIYSILAGAMLGLAFDTKYLSFFLIPVILAYILWVEKFNLKKLINKNIVVVLIFSFLLFLPVLICLFYLGIGLYPFYYYFLEMYQLQTVSIPKSIPTLSEILTDGYELFASRFIWNSEFLELQFFLLYRFMVLLLLIAVLLFYIIEAFKGKKSAIFLSIIIILYYIILLKLPRHPHYFLYSFPFLYLMISHTALRLFGDVTSRIKNKIPIDVVTLSKVFLVVIATIYIVTAVTFGVFSSFSDRGENSWMGSAIDYIKKDILKNNYKDVTIGTSTLLGETTSYPLHTMSGIIDCNFTVMRIYTTTEERERKGEIIDIEKINKLRPMYLIVTQYHYEYYFSNKIKNQIFENYSIVFVSQTYPHKCFFFERKKLLDSRNLGLEESDVEGAIIIEDTFKKSLPKIMKVGKSYPVQVKIKNVNNSHTNFAIHMKSSGWVFIEEAFREFTLNKGSTKIIEFKIIGVKETFDEIPITVELYVNINNSYYKLDGVTDHIYSIVK